jgi:subtilase family serine protease
MKRSWMIFKATDRSSRRCGAGFTIIQPTRGCGLYSTHFPERDPLYHHYLPPQQFAERFGGDAQDYAALKQWAISSGLVISQESVGRLNLTVRGSANHFEKIFNTRINRYRAPGGSEFSSVSIKPTVPTAIAVAKQVFVILVPFLRVSNTRTLQSRRPVEHVDCCNVATTAVFACYPLNCEEKPSWE